MKSIILALAMSLAVFGANAQADQVLGEAAHKVVIQISTADPKMQMIAINNAVNVQKALGIDNVTVEIVAYGPGLSVLVANPANKQAARVKSLAMQNITFSACGNTMKKIQKKTGKLPVLVEGVGVVPGGVVRIMQLQEQGYSYIRP